MKTFESILICFPFDHPSLRQIGLSKVESPNLQVVAVLMPLDIKHHTVPHLKGLNSGLEP